MPFWTDKILMIKQISYKETTAYDSSNGNNSQIKKQDQALFANGTLAKTFPICKVRLFSTIIILFRLPSHFTPHPHRHFVCLDWTESFILLCNQFTREKRFQINSEEVNLFTYIIPLRKPYQYACDSINSHIFMGGHLTSWLELCA